MLSLITRFAWVGLALHVLLAGALAAGTAAPRPGGTIGQEHFIRHNAAVFGKDERRPLPPGLAYLSRSIGLVSSAAERTMCTGFCVGRRTVATAAHCLFRTAGERRPNLATIRFTLGTGRDQRRTSIAGMSRGAHRQHVIAGSTALRVTPPIDATSDWALMRLEAPVCERGGLAVADTGPTQVHRLAARGRLLHVAFHGDLELWQLSLSAGCRSTPQLAAEAGRQLLRDFSDVAALVLHECDTGLASSGSPLLTRSPDGGLRVVAMNVGSYEQTRFLVTGEAVRRRFKPTTVANTAVSANAFAQAVLAIARADILSRRQELRILQQALKTKGFNPGPIDGIYGLKTRAAVASFEWANGRPRLGLATRQLLREVQRYVPSRD